jgi:hypothetical protein
MTSPRDPNADADRLINAFLAEGQAELPEQIYDEVRAEVDHTNQRTFFGPWRTLFVTRFATVAAVAVVMVIAVIVGLQLGQGGPLIGGDPSASPTTSAEPSASEKPTPDPTSPAEPSAKPSAEPTGPEGEFSCGDSLGLEAANGDFHPLVVSDIRLGTHDGYDRIVFEYVADGTPYLDIEQDTPPFVKDPSGLPLEVAGDTFFRVTFTGATKYDTETGEQPYTGPVDFEPGYEQIAQFVEAGDFEATHSWYLGTNGSTCLRAFYLTDPARMIIDVQH